MNKHLIALLLALACILAGCASTPMGEPSGSSGPSQEPSQPAGEDGDPLRLLEKIWALYPEEDRFPAMGGDMSEENSVSGGPGRYDLSDGEAVDAALVFPPEQLAGVDGAASLVHLMNANTFTCAVFHAGQGTSVDGLAAALRDHVLRRNWVCGFPEKLIVAVSGSNVVSAFGNGELMEQFRGRLVQAVPEARVVYEESFALGE